MLAKKIISFYGKQAVVQFLGGDLLSKGHKFDKRRKILDQGRSYTQKHLSNASTRGTDLTI